MATSGSTVLFFEPPSADPLISGARPAILATIYLGIIIIVLSVPLGVGTAIYLEEYANKDRWYNRMLEVNIPEPRRGALDRLRDPGPCVPRARIGLGRVLLAGGMILTLLVLPTVIIAAREAIARPGLDPPGRLRARLDEVAGRLAAGVTGGDPGDRDRLDPRALPGLGRDRAAAARRSAHLRLVQPDDHRRLHRASRADLPVDRPTRRSSDAGGGGIIVLLAILLTLNAFAIWLRNKYERRW